MIEYEVARSRRTQIHVERGAARTSLELAGRDGANFFLLDQTPLEAMGDAIHLIPQSRRLILPSSERNKTLETLERILSWMQSSGFKRGDNLIAVGGGVVVDIAGFAAAVYLRGVSYELVPTSLIAQVDASIGGKVGLNFGSAKNSLGSFWHPRTVRVDPALLSTLSTRDYAAGLAECVKVACCQESGELFDFLERNVGLVLRRDEETLDHLIRLSIAIKWDLLQRDPFESDLDRVLNLGHTTAHALEHATGYGTYRHGEAVSIGIGTAARYAQRNALIAVEDSWRIQGLLIDLGLPTHAPRVLIPKVKEAMSGVLRVRGNKVRYVVPTGVGRVSIHEPEPATAFLSDLANDN